MAISDQIVRRFRAARELTPEKLKDLLLKFRKGTGDSSITLAQTLKILEALGSWHVSEIVGLVQLSPKDRKTYVSTNNEQAIQYDYENAKKDEVRVLPTTPENGRVYVMDISPITSHSEGKHWSFNYLEWRGVNGLRLKSPEGKTYDYLPSRHNLNLDLSRLSLELVALKKWLRDETSFLSQVNSALGMDPHEKAIPRTRANTGTCPACFANVKLKNQSGKELPTIVLHGYKRPGWGSVQGRCFGVDYPPFELSPKGTEFVVGILKSQLENRESFLKRLQAGEVTMLSDRSGIRMLTPESEGSNWKYLISDRTRETEHEIKMIKSDISKLEKLISEWKLLPLPQEGEPHRFHELV